MEGLDINFRLFCWSGLPK